MTNISVFGAGAFGTALSIALSRNGTQVTLISRDSPEWMDAARMNHRYLPRIRFPETLKVRADVPNDGSPILLAVPMQALGTTLSARSSEFAGRLLVSCCKGLDLANGVGPSTLIREAFPNATHAHLTGPSFAIDLATGLPTALTLACTHTESRFALQQTLSREALRIYLSDDVIGAELGGALKNVVALAAGMTIGAGFGESARAAVVTRGFAEIRAIATTLGAKTDTLSGLSGYGDLLLTATSEKSRNFQAGLQYGQGAEVDSSLTIEGIATAAAFAEVAKSKGLDAPLISMVAEVTKGRCTVLEARDILLARPPGEE